MKNRTFTITLIIIATIFFTANTSVFAQEKVTAPVTDTRVQPPDTDCKVGSPDPKCKDLQTLGNPLKAKNIQQLILGIVNIAIYIGTLLAILMIIYTGFMYIMARGNPAKISEVHRLFMYVVIGTAILLGSKIIVEIIRNTVISAGLVDKSLF